MSMLSGIGQILGIAGGAVAANQAKKANDGARGAMTNAINASQVDLQKAIDLAHSQALTNAANSQSLEDQYNPGISSLRSATTHQLLASLGLNPTEQSSMSAISGAIPGLTGGSDLLRQAIARASGDLSLGGRLDPSLQNLVTRHALATAGMVNPGSVSLGRDLTARDLGIASNDLLNQRLQNAGQLGQAEVGMNQASSGNLINLLQLFNQIGAQPFNRALQGGQFSQSIQAPQSGLDPGALVSLMVGNQNNLANAYSNQAGVFGGAANGWLNLAGQAFGMGAGAGSGTPALTGGSSAPSSLAKTGGAYSGGPISLFSGVGSKTSGFNFSGK